MTTDRRSPVVAAGVEGQRMLRTTLRRTGGRMLAGFRYVAL